jgi:hypothetical protein
VKGERSAVRPDPFTRFDLPWGIAALAAGIALRLTYIRIYRFDSDEPQHLHVAWGWAHGWVQYRDFFDNHTPLFHLLSAPLVRWFGDRPDLLYWMRGAMLPLFLLTLWFTYRIGKALYGRRVGWWGALAAGLFVPFFVGSVEYRTDDLWAFLWIAAVYLWVSGPATWTRAFLLGLVVGAAFSVSMKTIALAVAAALAAGVVAWRFRTPLPSPRRWGRVAAFGLGAAVVPGVILGGFARLGALPQLYYGTIGHNLIGGMDARNLPWRPWLFVPALALITAVVLRWHSPLPERSVPRRLFVHLSAWYHVAVVLTLWPLITQQDFLPIWPLLLLPLAAQLARSKTPAGERTSRHPLLVGFVVAELAWGCVYLPWHDRTSDLIEAQRAVLDLTEPNEFVMDRKGELVFRPRSTYWVFERITRTRVDRGSIRPDVPNDLARHRVPVIANRFSGLPNRAQRFARANYLPVGPVRVLGQHLAQPAPDNRTVSFRVEVSNRYRMLTPSGDAEGVLDGVPLVGSRTLDVGWHWFTPRTAAGPWTLLWARAAERGYLPRNVRPTATPASGEP